MAASKLKNPHHGCEIYSFEGPDFEKAWITEPTQLMAHIQANKKIWINIPDRKNQKWVDALQKIFTIHPLVIEDIQATNQQPKIEFFEDLIFISLKMIYSTDQKLEHLKTESFSILFGDNFIITFQEKPEDIFDLIRVRLENPHGKMRRMGTDYFTYTLLDTIIDQYYHILEIIITDMEKREDRMLKNSEQFNLSTIYSLRKKIEYLRRNTWSVREILSKWKKEDHRLLKKKIHIYINGAYHHCMEIIDNLEIQKEALNSLVEMYMALLSIRQNEITKTLTIIATIFIPLTFLAGVYGMNFENMPELKWKYGYFATWILFVLVVLALIFYFKRRKWL